jgi:dephospho-CoA kinase
VAANNPETVPRILGLTGPIACGKTTVGSMLLRMGALARIDADEVVHELMEPGTVTTGRIGRAFGADVIAPDGAVDRKVLGKRVFADRNGLIQLEDIVHPEVRLAIRHKLRDFVGREGIVILDAVKLLQSDLAELCAVIWVVQCDPTEELRRLTDDRAMSAQDAGSRLASQPTFDDSRVSIVIDNSGGRDETLAQVWRHWEDLTRGSTG